MSFTNDFLIKLNGDYSVLVNPENITGFQYCLSLMAVYHDLYRTKIL